MDNIEVNKNQSFKPDHDFLLDEDFIQWRLFRTEELDKYWMNIIKERPYLEKAFREAISQFRAIQINQDQLPQEDKKEIYKTVLLNIHRYKRQKLLRRIGSVAAVLIIVFLSTLLTLHQKNSHPVRTSSEKEISIFYPEKKKSIYPRSPILGSPVMAKRW